MAWRLVRENVLGMAEFEWNRGTQQEQEFTAVQVQELEQGKTVHTSLRGGTDFYLVEEVGMPRVPCPTCGGKGYLNRIQEKKRKRRII